MGTSNLKGSNDVKEIKYTHNALSEKLFYSSGDEFVCWVQIQE